MAGLWEKVGGGGGVVGEVRVTSVGKTVVHGYRCGIAIQVNK